jgi:TRAP-type mannitol/chloroaromatic compound transport system permease small subunit
MPVMRVLLSISALIDRFSSLLGAVVSWMCLLMILIGAFNAIARYAGRFIGFNFSSNAMLETQWYLFAALFLLGASWTLQQDAHVRVDVLFGRLSKKHRAIVDVAGGLLFLLPFCIFGIWTSMDYVLHSWQEWEVSPDPGGLPRYPVKTLIPTAFALLILQGSSEIIKRIAIIIDHDEEAA